jgi:hypothetical protein
MIERWQSLLEEIDVRREIEQDTRTSNELHLFEIQKSIILPNDYKSFCQVFGSGVFGSYLTIFCPEIDQVEIDYLKVELRDSEVEGSELSYRIKDGESENIDVVERVLDRAFIFGSTSGGELLVWDLESLELEDIEYSIYMTRVEDFPGIYRVGRNFFEFILLFGLGIGSYEHLPEWTQPSFDELDRTFTPIKIPR